MNLEPFIRTHALEILALSNFLNNIRFEVGQEIIDKRGHIPLTNSLLIR